MGFNDSITNANVSGLFPADMTDELLGGVAEQSAVLRLARRLRNMPTATRTMPVVSSLPVAYILNGRRALKQTTTMAWGDVTLTAEEIPVIVAIGQSDLDDSNYPIWDQVKPYIVSAAGKVLDAAVLYGDGITAAWTAAFGSHAGLVALATAHGSTVSLAAKTDLYEAMMDVGGLLSLVESDGFIATGHIAHTSLKGYLRGCRDANGQPIFKSGPNVGSAFATGEIDGAPVLYPLNGSIDAAQSLDIAGQWSELVYAIRQDVSWSISDSAVIQDAAGGIVFNLFQQDMVALRMVFRVGFALPNPINQMNEVEATRSPFAVLTP